MARKLNLAEKYRPKRLDEIIGQDEIVRNLKIIVEAVKRGERDLPHMLFVGKPGVGKTTTAHALANELGLPIVEFNASDERGIDVIRNKIKRIAFTVGKRIILLDEADSMTEDAQHALRRIMEKAQANTGTRFILTANYEWKIIDPIKSRCAIYRFKPIPREVIIKRLVEILVSEGVKINRKQLPEIKKALGIIVDASQGDMRKALNLLEEILASHNNITVDIVRMHLPVNVAVDAINLALSGDFEGGLRKLEDVLIENRLDVETTLNQIYNAIKQLKDNEVKAKLFMELARAEHALKMGGSPLIQLAGLIASAWVYSRTRERK